MNLSMNIHEAAFLEEEVTINRKVQSVFPQVYRLDEQGKLLLMAPSYDRSGTVGFRCAEDAE